MQNLLSLDFWFNVRPGSLAPIYQRSFIIFIVILIIAFIALNFIKSRNKDNLYNCFWSSLSNFCLANIIIGLFLLFFTYELVPLLSSRFWFLLWGFGMIVWLIFIFRKLKSIPEKRKKIENQREYKKYIP
ncbi:MAG: hypothetical protein ABIA02_04335 [Candidatus Falkowbacteria bacterium]